MLRRLASALALGILGCLGGCAARPAPFAWPEGWRAQALPAASPARSVVALRRAALAAPERLRVIVLPGSGCTGFAPFAERYFASLLHAQVWALHKSGASPDAGAAPLHCPPGFVQDDALSSWQDDARAALQALPPGPPTVLVGISEGGELLPALAAHVPQLVGLVLLSSPGLDPRDVARAQAERQNATPAWQAVQAAARSALPDAHTTQGRSLRYWRDLMDWRVAEPLLNAPWPLLQVWGDADALAPPSAYMAFIERAQAQRRAPWCSLRLAGADHGLQRPGDDGVQRAWAVLEQWARHGALPCAGAQTR